MNKILTITGLSGAGKSTISQYIKRHYFIKPINSYTDRLKRSEDDTEHRFITPQEFNHLNPKDMIAYTKYGNTRYCCLKSDINGLNTYVIEETGIDELKTLDLEVKSMWVETDELTRYERLMQSYEHYDIEKRLIRDHERTLKPLTEYDYVLNNNQSFIRTSEKLEDIMRDWLGYDLHDLIERWR